MSKNQEGSESTFLASLIRPRLSALSAAALDQPLECPGVLQPGQPASQRMDQTIYRQEFSHKATITIFLSPDALGQPLHIVCPLSQPRKVISALQFVPVQPSWDTSDSLGNAAQRSCSKLRSR